MVSSPIYDLERADSPTQAGTPLSKASLLSDATAAALGLSGDPTVDDALNELKTNIIDTNGNIIDNILEWPLAFNRKLITYTSSTTWTRPSDMIGDYVFAVCIGGGGGRGGNGGTVGTSGKNYAIGGYGGGGGSGFLKWGYVKPTAGMPITVGAGGSPGTNVTNRITSGTAQNGTNGTAGGVSQFGSVIALGGGSGKGGTGGNGNSTTAYGGKGGDGGSGMAGGSGGQGGYGLTSGGTGGKGGNGFNTTGSNGATNSATSGGKGGDGGNGLAPSAIPQILLPYTFAPSIGYIGGEGASGSQNQGTGPTGTSYFGWYVMKPGYTGQNMSTDTYLSVFGTCGKAEYAGLVAVFYQSASL